MASGHDDDDDDDEMCCVRMVLGVTRRHRIRNEVIRERLKIEPVIERITHEQLMVCSSNRKGIHKKRQIPGDRKDVHGGAGLTT